MSFVKQMSSRIREIRGNKYLYFTYYEDGKKQEVYCGLASSSEAKRKALQSELDYLKRQKKELIEKISKIESMLE
ncbi:MAG: hypothetical protein HZA84_06125 [Thaumarchaeota archaeon]|nr:hypothetical protein [Nitrososphaerota archaeon]